MKIVKFEDGSYAIRRRILFWFIYMDTRQYGYWWTKGSRFFKDCKIQSFEDATTCFHEYHQIKRRKNDVGTPV